MRLPRSGAASSTLISVGSVDGDQVAERQRQDRRVAGAVSSDRDMRNVSFDGATSLSEMGTRPAYSCDADAGAAEGSGIQPVLRRVPALPAGVALV